MSRPTPQDRAESFEQAIVAAQAEVGRRWNTPPEQWHQITVPLDSIRRQLRLKAKSSIYEPAYAELVAAARKARRII